MSAQPVQIAVMRVRAEGDAAVAAYALNRGTLHELRINDAGKTWRLIYRIDSDAIVVADVFAKKTERTPDEVVRNSQRRLKDYDTASREAKEPRSKRLEGRKRKGVPGSKRRGRSVH